MGRFITIAAGVLFAVLIAVSALNASTDRQRMIAKTYHEQFDTPLAMSQCIAEHLDGSDLRDEVKNVLATGDETDIELTETDMDVFMKVSEDISRDCN